MPQGEPGGMRGEEGNMGHGGMGGPMGQGFGQPQETEEEETTVSTKKALSEFGTNTWVLLGSSALVLSAAIFFALKFKHY